MNSKASDEALLTEYRVAHEKHDYYGRMLWQTGSIFLTASLAGFAFGLQQDLPLDRFIPLTFVLSTLLLFFLFKARRMRWLAFVYLQRCEEIEKEIGMKAVTYQRIANEREIEISGIKIKPQKITGRHLNQGIPIVLLIIFWCYIINKGIGLI